MAAGRAMRVEAAFAEALAALAAGSALPDRADGGDSRPAADREIAALHGTSAHTVAVHVGQILAKLGAPTRAAAAATAVRLGLI